jgi:hypothetical protein
LAAGISASMLAGFSAAAIEKYQVLQFIKFPF